MNTTCEYRVNTRPTPILTPITLLLTNEHQANNGFSESASTYPRDAALSVGVKLHSVVTEGHRVALNPFIPVVSTLGSDALQASGRPQVDLEPLLAVVVASEPGPSGCAVVPRLQSGVPRAVVVVVHGRSGEHGSCNSTVLYSKRHSTRI